MTAQEWVTKFGVRKHEDGGLIDLNDDDVEIMGGNLEEMACTECGCRTQFRVEVRVMSDLEDESFDPDSPDYSSFDGDSYCRCCSCGESGDVGGFKIIGLDSLLQDILDQEEESKPETTQPQPPPPPEPSAWNTEGIT